MSAGIYKISTPSNYAYIGQSWDIKKRWKGHAYARNKKVGVSNSILKHGAESHVFSIVHELPLDAEQSVMDEYERLYISLYKQAGVKLLNGTDGGIGHKGGVPWNKGKKGLVKMPEETRAKMREASARRKIKVGFKKGHKTWNTGTKGLTKAWNKGVSGVIKLSAETRKKMSESAKSADHSKKKGRIMPPKTRAAIAKANIGRAWTNEQRAVVSKIRTEKPNRGGVKNKGAVRTEENKRRISETLKNGSAARGESNWNSKFTSDEILRIREEYSNGCISYSDIAKKYKVAKSSMMSIIKRETWKHI